MILWAHITTPDSVAFVGLADAKNPESFDLWSAPLQGGEARATGAHILTNLLVNYRQFSS